MENKFDLEANLSHVINTSIQKIEDKEQVDVLDSNVFNEQFQYMEDSLNLLYEKTRTLQNIMEYAESFVKSEIDKSVLECRTLLSDIESNRDLIRDSAYINYSIKLQSIFDTYSDRDNSPIKGVEYHNGIIGLSNSMIEDIEIAAASVESKEAQNIMNTADTIDEDKGYRTFYMFDRPQDSPVKERVVLTLSKTKTINKVNLIATNCNVDSIEYISENGKIEEVSGYDTNLVKSRDVCAIAINLSSTNYMISQVNYDDVKDQEFWTAVDVISSDEANIVDKKKYYYYLFGIDNLSLQYVDKEDVSCFVSKDVKVGTLEDQEYFAIDADYSCVEGSVEFYIMDGTTEIAILPEGETQVIEEKLFYKVGTRFTPDTSCPIKIYKDGSLTKETLNTAINDPDGGYTATYTPLDAFSIDSLKNSTVTLKAIIRSYNKNYIPFIKSIAIKKYGGGAIWKNNEIY